MTISLNFNTCIQIQITILNPIFYLNSTVLGTQPCLLFEVKLLTESITWLFVYKLIVMLKGFFFSTVQLYEFEFCLFLLVFVYEGIVPGITRQKPHKSRIPSDLLPLHRLSLLFIIIHRNPGAHLKTYKTLLQAFTIHLRAPDWVKRMCHVPLPLLYKGTVCFSQVELRDNCKGQ